MRATTQEEKDRSRARWAAKSDEQVLTEIKQYTRDLDRMTGEEGNVAFFKSNSLRKGFEEALRRGLSV